MIKKEIFTALNLLEEKGYEAFLVGGAVRNHLLHKTISDYDITTNADPNAIKMIFSNYNTYDIGKKLGTVVVVINKVKIDITPFRKEGNYTNHRRPETIEFATNLKDDLKRRDFTINALCLNSKSEIIDLYKGIDDLNNRIIRCIGNPDQRFHEDGLRILRALRFKTKLNFTIETKTNKSLFKNKDLLNYISQERKKDELLQILSSRNCFNTINEYLDIFNTFIPFKLETRKINNFSNSLYTLAYLLRNQKVNLKAALSKIKKYLGKCVNSFMIQNNAEIEDHHAIIPTASVDKANLEELPSGEREVLKLIATRLLEAVSAPCRYMETVIDADCNGHQFKAKGKQVIDDGWKAIAPSKKSDKDEDNDQEISVSVNAGEKLKINSKECKEGKTSAPKSFTEDTLLSAMEKAGADEIPDDAERKGLGTPATRAGIIEKLVRIGFIERRGDKKTKYLVPTHKGEALITIVPEAIQSASLTADWEQRLLEIEKDTYSGSQFMREIDELVSNLIDTYEVIPDAEVLMHPVYMPIGKCPHCGKDVEEKSKGFFCSDKECKFVLWKENRLFDSLSKKMTRQIAEQLLKNGKAKLKKCRSVKTGKTYDCTVSMTVNESGLPQFGLEFENRSKTQGVR